MGIISKLTGSKREQRIDIICSNTGWSKEKAYSELKRAFQLGISNIDYVNNEAWKLNEKEIEELVENIKERKKRKAERINIICSNTGWSEEEADKAFKDAFKLGLNNDQYGSNEAWNLEKEGHISNVIENTGWDREKAISEMDKAKQMGIPYWQYVTKYLFQLGEEDLKEFADLLLKNKEINNTNKDFYVDLVVEKTGWDREKAIDDMDKYNKLGVLYFWYVRNRYYEQDEKSLKKLLEFNIKRFNAIKNKNSDYFEKIVNKTGWSRGKVALETLRALVNHGASYGDYFLYKFDEKTDEEQSKYVTLHKFSKLKRKYNDITKSYIFDNKAEFNKKFDEFINRKWFLNEKLSYEQFLQNISGLNKVMIKPIADSYGRGIEVFECNVSEEKNRELYNHIVSLDKSIVEEYIVQHEKIMEFCETSVNTIRIVTLNYKNECKYIYSMFRMGKGKIVDNFHAGGVAANIDMETGITCTDAVDLECRIFAEAPATGVKVKGFQIPNWDIIKDTCEKLTGYIHGVNIVGWDFAITPDGVDLIEGNVNPSHDIGQMATVVDNKGVVDSMITPYM